MGLMSSISSSIFGSAPETPDYKGAAEATAKSANEQLSRQTEINRADRYNPWGSETWSQDGDKWTQNVNLSPEGQRAHAAQQGLQAGKSELAGGMMGNLTGELGTQMDWSKYGDQQGLQYNSDELRGRAEDASYARATSRLDPRFEQSDQALQSRLRNQGLSQGDKAYDNAMANAGRTKNDAYSQAQNAAVTQGRAEAGQAYGQQLGETNYANQLRQNAMSEEMKQRATSLNETNALISGGQVANPNFQSYNQAGRGDGVNYSGAAQAQGNADQANYQAGINGVTGLAGAGASAYGGGMFG
jgi:hypothetical protein